MPPPDDLGLVFADYIHNLRSVLDHIVWHLVVANGGELTTETGFPVVTDRRDWQHALDTRLRGFPEAWAGVVRDAQPFEVGDGAEQHPLYLLHRLDIASKHHNVVAMGVVGAGWLASFAFNRAAREGEEVIHVFAPPGTKLVDGVPLVVARCISEDDDLRVAKLEWIEDLDVGIGPISTLTDDGDGPLPNFLVFVGTVIEAMAPAFE